MRQVRGGAEIKTNFKILLITAATVVILDQATKILVMRYMYPNEVKEVISGLFNLVYYNNPGAAFGIFNRSGFLGKFFLIGVSVVSLFIIGFLVRQSEDRLTAFALSLIAGGAVGNLIDRLRFGSVVDFLEFYYNTFYWPAFNVADSAITTGVGLAILSYIRNPGNKQI